MALRLYYHPFASFCQKVLIAFYESELPFEPHFVDLANDEARAELEALWPPGRFPVLRDEARALTIPESTTIIEYLAQSFPRASRLLPADAQAAFWTRHWDRFFDNFVELPMQKVVTDRLRTPDRHDVQGVEEARSTLELAYAMIDRDISGSEWAAGREFDLADCAAAPALFYSNVVSPFPERHEHLRAYFSRLMSRPSVARVVEQAKPYRKLFPLRPGESFDD